VSVNLLQIPGFNPQLHPAAAAFHLLMKHKECEIQSDDLVIRGAAKNDRLPVHTPYGGKGNIMKSFLVCSRR
jgi:hypothetical protein